MTRIPLEGKVLNENQQVAEELPRYAEAHCSLGRVYEAQKKLDEAIASYRMALHLAPHFASACIRSARATSCANRLLPVSCRSIAAPVNTASVPGGACSSIASTASGGSTCA